METTSQQFELSENPKKSVQSLTRQVFLHETKKGDFFIKPDPQKKEYNSLKELRSKGVSVPDHYYMMDFQSLATKNSGINLMEFLKSNPKKFFKSLGRVQELMTDTHLKIQTIDPNILSLNKEHTAHPIKNYVHRFINFDSSATNSFLELDLSDLNNLDFSQNQKENFKNLYYQLIHIIESFSKTIEKISPDIEENKEIAFGDFKPENIIVDENEDIKLIDPELINGSPWFDVTKFVSRLILDEFSTKKSLKFIKKYNKHKNLESSVYRGLSIRALIHLDMTNILSSYLGRFIKQESEYRIVRRFCDDKMSKHLQKTLSQNFNYLFDN